MRVLSIRQPWVDAILYGPKRVENRVWSTPYRGTIALHAAKLSDSSWWYLPDEHPLKRWLRPGSAVAPDARGGIVGLADLTGVHPAEHGCGCDAWGHQNPRTVHFVLDAVRPLARPYLWPGSLGLHPLPEATVAELEQLAVHG